MPYEAYYASPDGTLRTGLNLEEISAAHSSGAGVLWVDVNDPNEDDARLLAEVFKFHHLAIEDCTSRRIHSPKIDDYGTYLFMVMHGIDHNGESQVVETAELGIFLGPQWVVSNHVRHLYSIDLIREQVVSGARSLLRGPDFVAHAMIDTLVDNVMPTIERMGEIAEDVEDDVIERPGKESLDTLMRLRRSAMKIHRVMAPQRETLNRLSRQEFNLIRPETSIFFRDIYDHAALIEDLNQIVLDRADYAISTYHSSIGNRQNETMKLLSIVATIILPLTLVTGIYGMNFENMPELEWEWGYFAVLGLLGAMVFGAVYMLWARRWIGWGRVRKPAAKLFSVEPARMMAHINQLRRSAADGKFLWL